MSSRVGTHRGGCHCGKIAFSFQAPLAVNLVRCNCSICTMTGFLHLIVPKKQFKLIRGKSHLSSYQFNTKIADHLFCQVCGVKSFYFPRSNPDGVSINMNCVEQSTFAHIHFDSFDGQNWEENAASLAHLA